jgi:fatty acid desaturase
MSVAARVKPEDFFTPEEWQSLSARSNWRGFALVLHCWLTIGLAIAVGVMWPMTIPLVVMVVGNRQLGLNILMHDAAHALLHENRKINDFVAYWFCAPELFIYRPYHLQHHRFVQQSEDPDLVLSKPFPITRASLWRKIMRDLTGQTFFKQRSSSFVAGIKRSSSETSTPAFKKSALSSIVQELSKQRMFFICNGLGLLAFSLAGLWWAWLLMWLLPMMTWLPLVSRLRNIAEHALIVENGTDPLRHARTTYANWLERMFIAPYWVNYHCEHHMFTQIPCWNLPKAHRLLVQKGVTTRMEIQPSYPTVLKLASSA